MKAAIIVFLVALAISSFLNGIDFTGFFDQTPGTPALSSQSQSDDQSTANSHTVGGVSQPASGSQSTSRSQL
jgi:hypothetical protein